MEGWRPTYAKKDGLDDKPRDRGDSREGVFPHALKVKRELTVGFDQEAEDDESDCGGWGDESIRDKQSFRDQFLKLGVL